MKFYLKLLQSYLLCIAIYPIRLLSVKKNRVLFIGLEGGGGNEYSCNPMYICEQMLKEYKGEYEIVWLVKDLEKYQFLKEKGIKLAKHFTVKGFIYCLTSKVVITNGGYISWFPFRKKQYVIDTWHGGGAYKKLENDLGKANYATKKRAEFSAKNIDLFISSCRLFEQYVIRGAFQYNGEVLSVGMPRNDILMIEDPIEYANNVRTYYNISSEKKIVLYAPTYRDSTMKDYIPFDHERILTTLEETYQGEWVFLYRCHVNSKQNLLFKENDRCINVADYKDMQELLCAADVLITDYSSSVWDFSLTYKPCFLYTPDLEEYMRKTNFYVSIEEWPFSIAKDEDMLVNNIKSFNNNAYKRLIDEHHELLGSCETGHATEAVIKVVRDVCLEGAERHYEKNL